MDRFLKSTESFTVAHGPLALGPLRARPKFLHLLAAVLLVLGAVLRGGWRGGGVAATQGRALSPTVKSPRVRGRYGFRQGTRCR